MAPKSRYWAIIPAAGSGSRMGSMLPKQYLSLLGKPVLMHSLARMVEHPLIAGAVVAIAADDPHWVRLELPFSKPVITAAGGSERCHSVYNALRVLSRSTDAGDWVLVHDAARPCVRQEDIGRLMEELKDHPVGGLLGVPVADTMKRTDADGEVVGTVDRAGLWRALTPQMFRLGALLNALQRAIAANNLVTDEAAAMEAAGYRPRMVEGHADNIKITRPRDLALAELYLRQQGVMV